MRPTERVRLCPWANRASWAEVCGVPRERTLRRAGRANQSVCSIRKALAFMACAVLPMVTARSACGLVVAAAGLTVVVDILGNGVVGRPAGASVRCDGGRGDPPFDDHGGTVTAVAPAVDALGSVNVDQTSLRIGAFRRGPSPGRTTGRPRSQTPPRNASSVVAARCAAGRRAATQGIGMAAVTSDQSLSNEGRALSSRRRRRPRRTARPTAPPVRVGAPRPPVIPLAWAAVVMSARRGCR